MESENVSRLSFVQLFWHFRWCFNAHKKDHMTVNPDGGAATGGGQFSEVLET